MVAAVLFALVLAALAVQPLDEAVDNGARRQRVLARVARRSRALVILLGPRNVREKVCETPPYK